MDKPVAAPAVGAKEKIDKQARQLAYDTRYKVKQSMKAKSGGRVDPAAMRKAFISQLAKSPSAPAIKARAKQMLMGEGYIDVKDLVKDHTANALYKVFVEHHQKDKDGNTIPHEDEEISEEKTDEKTYKVRVTDKTTGNSYVRMASRAKIADLRGNPNISSVEMTSYGEPTKSEKYKGKSTAKAKQGLDPVGKEDGDVDNDGDKDKSDKYLMKRRKAIGKAIAASEDKVWLDFKGLVEKKETEEKKITGDGVNNKKLIKVFPDEVREEMETKPDPALASKEKKANMAKKQVLMKKLQAVRMGAGSDIQASKEVEGKVINEVSDKLKKSYIKGATKEIDDLRKTKMTPMGMDSQASDKVIKRKVNIGKTMSKLNEMEDEVKPEMDTKPKSKKEKKEEDDPRSMPTKVNLAKNKLRAMGLNMGYEHDKGLVDAYNKIYNPVDEAKIDDKLRKDAQPIKGGGLYKSGMNKKVMGDRAVEARRNSNAAPKTGMYTDKFKAQAERQKEHESKRGVKTKGK